MHPCEMFSYHGKFRKFSCDTWKWRPNLKIGTPLFFESTLFISTKIHHFPDKCKRFFHILIYFMVIAFISACMLSGLLPPLFNLLALYDKTTVIHIRTGRQRDNLIILTHTHSGINHRP